MLITCVRTGATGEFDSADSTETKLRHLLDQRLIGNKEFHLLSGHALLGFRLLPGPVSETLYLITAPSSTLCSFLSNIELTHHHTNLVPTIARKNTSTDLSTKLEMKAQT